jgi:hypothetical protein
LHFHAIKKAVLEEKYNWQWRTEDGEGMKQRIADIRNYFILVAALMSEEKGEIIEESRIIIESSE